MRAHTCPVCGYGMDDTPFNHNICPSCGTQFGWDDFERSIADLREDWIDDGMRWWRDPDNPPKGWNPEKQLEKVTKRF